LGKQPRNALKDALHGYPPFIFTFTVEQELRFTGLLEGDDDRKANRRSGRPCSLLVL
jgi:hypothetical protein